MAGFGTHLRTYRWTAALHRLSRLPPTTYVPIRKAAHILGVTEDDMRTLVYLHAGADKSERNVVLAATLCNVIRRARDVQQR